MKLQQRLNPKTESKVLEMAVPFVMISKQALAKMWTYIDECSDEIGWLGTATRDANTIYIKDTFLFKQDVHGTTTEITPEGLTDFATELMSRPDGVEIWNEMRVWGHSHVNMGVSPSGQDNQQMGEFAKNGQPWFVRLIANKKGECKIDVYEYDRGLIHLDVPWEAMETPAEEEIQQRINALYHELEAMQAQYTAEFKEPVKAEMKEKVKKKTWARSTHNGVTTTYHNRPNGTIYPNGNNPSGTGTKVTSIEEGTGEKKKTDAQSVGGEPRSVDATSEESKSYYFHDWLTSDDDVKEYLDFGALVQIAHETSLKGVEYVLENYGYINYFTENDLERIYRVALKRAGAYASNLRQRERDE